MRLSPALAGVVAALLLAGRADGGLAIVGPLVLATLVVVIAERLVASAAHAPGAGVRTAGAP